MRETPNDDKIDTSFFLPLQLGVIDSLVESCRVNQQVQKEYDKINDE